VTVSEIRLARPNPAIAVVTIDRPARRNACNLAAWQGLARSFRELAGERAVRLVILTGAAGHFCAGADISEFATLRADSAGGAAYEREVEAAYRAIQELPQPSIAAIEGAGGGCALALCCDFRVLRGNVRFGIPAAKLGTVYTIEECRLLLSVVGVANAKRILFGGELFDAATASEMGFADTVVESDPVAAAVAFGEAMAANAPLAVAGIKRILQELAYGDVDARKPEIAALIREALDSQDYREGAAAFLEKRKPNFTGR
jgi:enoyl-CoA hydratase/carnithine racemase